MRPTAAIADQSLAMFLADRDMPCPQCDYNLRDLQGDRCPECGETLVLQIGVAEPRQALLIAGLVVLAAVAGFNGIMVLLGLVVCLLHGFAGQIRPLIFTSVGLLISGAALVAWLRNWRPIRRLPASRRRWLFLACCSLLIGDVSLLFLLLM